MSSPLVGVILGNRADFTAIRKGLETLRVMGVPYEFEVASPERTPEKIIAWAREAAGRGMEVIIAAAGGSSGLAGLISAHTTLPVIGLPIDSTPLRGEDSLFSMVQMPSGAPVGCVGVNAGENAAILAARILALRHPHYGRVLQHQNQNANIRQDTTLQELRNQYPDLTDPKVTAPDDHRLFITELETDPGFLFREEALAKAAGEPPPSPPPPDEANGIRKAPAPRVEPEPVRPHEPSPPEPDADEEAINEETSAEPSESRRESEPAEEAKARPSEEPTPPASAPEEAAKTGKGAKPKKAKSEGVAALKPLPRPGGRRPLADRLFRVAPDNPDVDVIEHAMFTLLEGGTVAVPTDTVYGIAVDATNAEAVEKLYRLKGRDRQKAMAILVHNTEMLSRLVTRFPEKVDQLIDEFWPGSLTIIFPKPVGALAGVSATPSIGVRIPDHNTTLALISMVARPLATTSANLAGQPPASTAQEVIEVFGDDLDCILDGGPAPGTAASTVLSVVDQPYKILREGAVSRADLHKILGDFLAR